MSADEARDDEARDENLTDSYTADNDYMTDNDLEAEIELVSELVVAATSSDGPMDQDEVDLLLGIPPEEASESSN